MLSVNLPRALLPLLCSNPSSRNLIASRPGALLACGGATLWEISKSHVASSRQHERERYTRVQIVISRAQKTKMLAEDTVSGNILLSSTRKFLSQLRFLAGRISNFLDQRPWAAISLIVLIYLPSAFESSRKVLLWHDELFMYWISQAPSLRAMWTDLQTLDLNPPLGYLLTRLSFHLLGVNTLATRLPELVGFLVTLLAVFQFVRHRLGAAYGLFSALLLMQSPVAELSVEARPYSLMLACLGVTLVGWQRAVDGRRSRSAGLVLMFVGTLGMLLSHVFALLGLSALILAELYRQYLRRARDLPAVLVLVIPLAAVASYIPLLRNHAASIFPPIFQPDGERIFQFYVTSMDHALLALLFTGLAVLVFLGGPRTLSPLRSDSGWFFSPPEWLLLLGLFLVPLALMLELMLTQGAFFDRYGAVETLAVVVLLSAVLARWTLHEGKVDGRPALLGCAIVILMTGQWLAIPHELRGHRFIPTIANSEPEKEPCEACGNTAAIDPTLPLVDASGLTFVEMNQRESRATLSRVFYLTDASASTEIAHANIFEHMSMVGERFHFAGHTDNYHAFIAAHPHFFVFGTYDYPEDWLLRKLSADQADIRVLDQVDDNYVNREVYEVRIDPAKH